MVRPLCKRLDHSVGGVQVDVLKHEKTLMFMQCSSQSIVEECICMYRKCIIVKPDMFLNDGEVHMCVIECGRN
jgi:hypothetical protein